MFESGEEVSRSLVGERVGECVTLQRRGGGRRSRSAITRVGGKISSNERESEAGREEGGRKGGEAG